MTYYKSADGYFESYYNWATHLYAKQYADYYINYVADDNTSGYYQYIDASGEYYLTGSWSIYNGASSYYYTDSYGREEYSYSDDAMWTYYDQTNNNEVGGSYDYYSSEVNEAGVTTQTYRSADGSEWQVLDYWTDIEGHIVTRTYNADGTKTFSHSVDGVHYVVADLNNGNVVVTPNTEMSFDSETGIFDFIMNGIESYMMVNIDENLDIIMEAMNNNDYLESIIYTSEPWNTSAMDALISEDITEQIVMNFDSSMSGTFPTMYSSGTFAVDSADHMQDGEFQFTFETGSMIDESEFVNVEMEVNSYTPRTIDTV